MPAQNRVHPAARTAPLRVFVDNMTALNLAPCPKAPWAGGRVLRHIAYEDCSPAQWLNLYLPDTPSPAPLLILVHGGGFVTNDAESRQARLMYRFFRDRGYACATVNYRLAGEARFPAAIEDVKAAVRFLGQQGQTYGYDTGRTAIWGESAGAYLAAMAALTDDDTFAGTPCLGETPGRRFPMLRFAALADFYGPCNLLSQEAQFQAMGIPRWVRRLANRWLDRYSEGFATAEECWMGKPLAAWTQGELQAFLPCRQAEAGRCPNPGMRSWILHGLSDITVPADQSREFAQVLGRAFGPDRVELVLVPHCKHADDRLFRPQLLAQLDHFLRESLDE